MRVISVLAALVAATPVLAQDIELGRENFMDACAGCHGVDAIGDGPAAQMLTVPVPDLTRISARNDAEFPRLRMIHIIDGTTGVRAHGGPMPLFGHLMRGEPAIEDAPDGTPVFADRRILAIVDYLESIQQ